MTREHWVIWDELTNRQCGMSGYFNAEQCIESIRFCQRRQKAGGRPDLETVGFIPRRLH